MLILYCLYTLKFLWQILIPFAAAHATTSVHELEVTLSDSVVSHLLLFDSHYVSGNRHFIYLFLQNYQSWSFEKKFQCLLMLLLFLPQRFVSHLHRMRYVQRQPTCALIKLKTI